ncbi:hypothetical protein G4B88_030704 [Cannabis sativa]|uniref:JmjC domain-containing protein n=1 Tax=Cannabis sativa TaxID=3483 RepID=A0A7J6H8D9_CANSA|nr:hypothetical protein G4B88_030704 [Cannabis sativa]
MKLENYFRLSSEYEVSVYFWEDLFGLLGNERPDYRWIIIGPAGSNSSFHIDPNSTSAWNAVIKGSKKWVLFPPDVTPPGVHPSLDGAEVIFVPNGWWHLVINLEESVAITQNYVSMSNLLNVLDFLQRPNASELVSETKYRVNLYEKFKNTFEASFPEIIDQLTRKVEEKRAEEKKPSFWDFVTDSKAGAFKFSY